jgi:TolB-like protein/Tfp pilus assembly protein PilF
MAVLYAVAAWLIMQAAEVVIGLAHLPDWIGPTTLGLLAVGFPIALIFSWFYELTPEGISLEKDVDRSESITHVTGRRLDFIVISLLCAAVILFAYDKWWIGPPPEKSIAVLAFENMSDDPGQEYFSDGISEELLNLLAQIPELRVISRSSAFSFKGKDISIPTVAEQLNVAHVLEGSVRKMGNRVRITAQLIEASSDSHLWSESYDRELDDIFAVQDEIAGAISDALKVTLALVAGEPAQPKSIKAASTKAYDAYLRGRELIRLRGRENLHEAVRHLERSLRLDNNFAPAHAHLAIATALLIEYGTSTPEEAWRTAIPHLDRAQALEPDLAEVHGGRALLAFFVGDPESAIEHARKALALNPSYTDAMNWLQEGLLDQLGRYEESDATLKRMLAIDPLNIIGRYNYAERLSQTGRIDEAHELADQLLAQSPRWGYQAHAVTSLVYEGKIAEGLSWALKFDREIGRGTGFVMFQFIWVGEYDEARRINESESYWVDLYAEHWDEAIRATQRNLDLDPDNEYVIGNAALILYLAGRVDEALPLYERLREFVPEGRPIPGDLPVVATMRLALARRKGGDEDGAQAAAQIAKQDHAARRAAGRKNQEQDLAEAMIAAFEHNPEGAIPALKSAIQRGLRDPWFFDDLIFEDMWDEPRFIALKQELDAIFASEHEKVLQLICFNNPTPDNWQPLPETCEGVVERLEL